MSNIIYPRILNKSNKLIAVLQNAYGIGYTLARNQLWTCQFTLPLNDSKVDFVKPKYFVELYDHDDRIGMFIVNPKMTVKNESTNEITYHCEHVLSLLHSDVLFGYHQYTNYTTSTVLQGLIDSQEIKHWRLGNVAFTRYFHYSWENEDSLLNAIMSTPKPFAEPYIWTWDDSQYPFTLNLERTVDDVKGTVIAGKNLKGIEVEEDPTHIVTRIYPLGFGEGVNQLTIAEVNGGSVYLEDEEAREEYGLHKRIWVDSRFENAESLKASGQAILDKYNTPLKSVSIDAIDYKLVDPYDLARYKVGDVLLVYDQDTKTEEEIRLEKLAKNDIYGSPHDMQLELGDLREDITTTTADMEQKQLTYETYSQGSTNIDSRDFSDNCDPNFPAVIRFPIPDDVVNINEMTLTFETQPFRAFERAIKGGGAIVSSTESGGAVVTATEAGGGIVNSTSAGGEVVSSSTGRIAELDGTTHGPYRGIGGANSTFETLPGGSDGHTHTIPYHAHDVRSESHSHDFSIPAHTHSVSIPNHTHNISIPAHRHDITLPDHTHEIEYGIFESPASPTRMTIKVDGTVIPYNETSGNEINLLPYLAKDGSGRIQRGRYAEIEIRPNNLARINATVTSRLFIQSRLGVVM